MTCFQLKIFVSVHPLTTYFISFSENTSGLKHSSIAYSNYLFLLYSIVYEIKERNKLLFFKSLLIIHSVQAIQSRRNIQNLLESMSHWIYVFKTL